VKKLPMMSLLVLVCLLSAAASSAQCVRYESFDHCPVGDAKLYLSSDGSQLLATNLDADGSDGLTSMHGSATLWSADLRFQNLAVGDEVYAASISNGFVTSGLRMRAFNRGWQLKAEFTGAISLGSYHLTLINDDEPPIVDGDPGGYGPSDRIHFIPLDDDFAIDNGGPDGDPGGDDGLGQGTMTFTVGRGPLGDGPDSLVRAKTALGACSWGFRFAGRGRVLVNGILIGEATEIRFVEDVTAPGHYPYTEFDSMQLNSSGTGIVVHAEATISNGF